MPSFSTSDTVTDPTPNENKNQSLTEEPFIANKSDSNLKPLDQDGVSGKKKKKKNKNKKRRAEERLLMEAAAVAEEEENNAGPLRRSASFQKKRRIDSRHDSHLGRTSQVDCHAPQIITREYEKLLQRHNTINGQQSGQIPTSQLKLTDQPEKVQECENNGCPTQNMASGVIVDNHKKEIQLQNNVGNISEVPDEVPEGKTIDNFAASGRGLKWKKGGGKGGKYMRTNDGSKPVELSKPAQIASFHCKLCDVKCYLQVNYKSHLNGKKHLHKLRCAHDHQVSLGAGLQAVSGGLLGLQTPKPPKINALSNPINAQDQQGDNNPQVPSKPVELSKPAEIVPFTCELCDIKCTTQADYKSHLNGKRHLNRLRCACDHQVLLGAGQQAVSGGLLGLQTLKPSEINALSNAINAQGQQGDNNPQVLSKPVELSKPAEIVPFTCELCNLKCNSEVDYLCHANGRKHLYRLKLARYHQVLFGEGQQAASGGLLGLQTLYPPDINDLSNAIDAQVQQGDGNNPQVLLAQLLMTVLSKTQVPATAPVPGAVAAEIPAPTSMAGPSSESQLSQTQVSEITAHVGMENPSGETKTEVPALSSMAGPSPESQLLQTQVSEITAHVEMENLSGETKTEVLPVPPGSNAQPGSSVSTQI